MLKIYNQNKVFSRLLEDCISPRIDREAGVTDMLQFDVPLELGDFIKEEGYAESEVYGMFVIKEKNLNGRTYQIIAKYDLEDLHGIIPAKAYVTQTIAEMMADLLSGTGWTVSTSVTIQRTVTGLEQDRRKYITKIADTFGVEIRYDNVAKVIYMEEELGEDKGVYFHDEVNLKKLEIDSDTYDFATRIIPRGLDGISIESINGGLPYVANHTYSNKVVTEIWEDERYTNLDSLKADAIKKLEKLCKPICSYSASVEDLSRTKGLQVLSYEVYDTITLVDRESGTREKQRIAQKVIYLDETDKDSVVIANRARYIEDEVVDEAVRQTMTITKASLELLDDSIQARVVKTDYEADKLDTEQLIADSSTSSITTMQANLDLTAEGLRTEASTTYTRTTEFEEYKSQVSTQFIQTDEEFNFWFNNLTQNITDVDGATQTEFEEIRKYIRFVDGSILLGEIGNQVTLKLMNNRMSFLTGTSEVAYFADNKMYVNDGHFINSLRVGNFAFTPRTNGNLSFGKIT